MESGLPTEKPTPSSRRGGGAADPDGWEENAVFWASTEPTVGAPCLTNLKCGAGSHFWVERAAVSSQHRRNEAAPLVGRGPEHRSPDSSSPSSLFPTHQYIDVLLLREEGTHFLHISAKDGLDQGRLQGEPAFRERARATALGSTQVGGGRRWRGSATGVLAAADSRGTSTGRQAPKDTRSAEGSTAWGAAGAAGTPGSGPA